ncbi:MAG: LVIVD repeat-containing protein [Planctomycetota bacterium]|jgi:hypothetical protein
MLRVFEKRQWFRAVILAQWLGAAFAFGQIPPLNVAEVGNWDGHPDAYRAADCWADGRGFAYVGNRDGATIDIMDIRNPVEPTLLSTYVIPAPNNFCNAKDVKVHDGLMYIGMDDDGADGAQIVDVRNIDEPVMLTNVNVAGFSDIHNLFYDNGFLFLVTSRDSNMAVVDLREFDPDNPPDRIEEALWQVSNIGDFFVHDVTVVGNRAYLSAWDSGIWVYDITDLGEQAPTFLGAGPGNSTHSAWATRDGRWIVTNEERGDGGPVKLYEYEEDNNGNVTVTHRNTFSIPTTHAPSSHNVYVIGYRAYCAWYNRGLMAFDINPEFGLLSLVAHFDTSVEEGPFNGAWGAYPFNGRDQVILSDKFTQFWVFDVRVPGSSDFDGDADVDLQDYGAFNACLTGDGEALVAADCDIFDTDGDLDVDQTDYQELYEAQTGPR